jgi:DNA-directed RNA polymerase
VKWADDHWHEIEASAEFALGRNIKRPSKCMWWLKEGEDHWQGLAACIEILQASECTKGPQNYLCALPVQLDGSCNGLQHYAALGRDQRGGEAVNLVPSIDKPADVYTDVLKIVQTRVGREQGDEENPNYLLAKIVHGKLNRKIVKQTVMTSVYGVTMIGARDQIKARLADSCEVNWDDAAKDYNKAVPTGELTGDDLRVKCAGYLAKVTMDSIGDVFTVGKQIMNWLKMCSVQLSLRGHATSWVTPLGLPVVQPYRQDRRYSVRTSVGQITLSETSDLLPVDAARQKDALPPNFVHSLDATHMFMTAQACKQLGLTFASVHDSFWTHAGDVNVLGKEIRNQFYNVCTFPVAVSMICYLCFVLCCGWYM